MSMTINPFVAISIFVLYMAFLFAIAYWAEQKPVVRGRNVAENAIVYSLSLAVYCTSWTFYGTVGLAATSGFVFLSFYIGPTLGIVLWWTVLRKLVRIKSKYRITSIADFISARYDRSQGLAMLVTLGAIVGIAPYVALQLKALITTFNIIASGTEEYSFLAHNAELIIVLLMIAFTIIFGVRHIDPTERHRGVVFAVAVESLVKLAAFLVVGIYVTFFLFDGFGDIFHRFEHISEALSMLGPGSFNYVAWMSILFLSMAAIVFLPRQFHISVVENSDEKHILSAMCILPIYLLLITVFVMPLAMAGLMKGLPHEQADTFVLRMPMIFGQKAIALLAFIGGFSAATSMIVISAMTMSTMITNHLILPVTEQIRGLDFLKRYVLQFRWAAVTIFILISYWFEKAVGEAYMLVNIGIISFAAALQFAPAIILGIFWTRANKIGAIMGLCGGFAVWFYTMFLPALAKSGWIAGSLISDGLFGISILKPEQLFGMTVLDPVSHCMFWSMFANIGLLLFGSLFFEQSREENELAMLFVQSLDTGETAAQDPGTGATVMFLPKKENIIRLLSSYFPEKDATNIFKKCVARSGFIEKQKTSFAQLSNLMNEIEKALSGSFGSAMAHRIMARSKIYTSSERRQLREYYSDLLVGMNVSPEELRSKIDYFKERQELLSNHAKELEKLVKERTSAKEQAEAASQAKSLFLANMSHELRSPLNVIMGYTQLMQKDVLFSTEQREYLNTINRSGENLLTLINDVLEISKIEAGQLTFESTTFDLPAFFYELEKAFESGMDDKGLFFEIVGIDDLPRYVTTDETKLRQVLVNILDNAVKFTEQGGITVRVTAKDETAGAMRLAVEVQDTGIGIAKDELGKVFAYLEQTAGGRAKKRGTGLGLAISRDYVRMLGGDISVTSKAGKGSTFRFEINIKKGRGEDIKALIPKQRVMGLQPGQKVPRILVAEDNGDSRILLVKMLEAAGFEVEEAVNGKEAVDIFNQWHPDLIWMDIRMPVMDGLEAARRIKKTEAGQSTIVAALTAHALAEEKERILAAGCCDDFVPKPFREQEIFDVIAKHLGLQYVYEEQPVEPEAGLETEAQVTPQQLAALPADLLSRLHDAVVELDKERILALIEQIKTIDAHMARVLDACVKRFALSALLDMLEKIKMPEHGDSYD